VKHFPKWATIEIFRTKSGKKLDKKENSIPFRRGEEGYL
jgi:hypothetical protein